MGKRTGTTTSRDGYSDNSEAQKAAVRAFVESVIQRADEDAELVSRLFKAAGVASPAARAKEGVLCPAAVSLALKAAAMMRLLRWRQTPGLAAVASMLPTPEDLLRDIGKPPARQQYDGKQVAFNVFQAWRDTMSWSPIARGTDVSVRDVQPQPVADELAQLLWQFRHLMDNNSTRKEE